VNSGQLQYTWVLCVQPNFIGSFPVLTQTPTRCSRFELLLTSLMRVNTQSLVFVNGISQFQEMIDHIGRDPWYIVQSFNGVHCVNSFGHGDFMAN
jgi:hypothetical protein